MATLSSELTLVMRFHQISQNYSARPAVARRNTLPTLLRFLQSKDRQIRKYALEAVEMLVQHPDNVEYLGEYPKLVDSVFSIYKEAQYDDPELCERASSVLDALEPTFKGEDPRKAEVVRRATQEGGLSCPSRSREPSSASIARSDSNAAPVITKDEKEEEVSYDSICQREYQRHSSILHSSADAERRISPVPSFGDYSSSMGGNASATATASSPVSAVVEVPALRDLSNRKEIEELLASVQGILSYTVSPSLRQIRLFLSNANVLSKVQHALTSAGYINLLLRSEKVATADAAGRQSTMQRGKDKKSFYDDESRPPSYLDSAKGFASSLYNAVIVYTKPDSNTLAARVRRQREVASDASHNPIAERVARTFANWW